MKKINIYVTFSKRSWENNCNFTRFGKKNQNKLRLSQNTM